MQTLHNSCSAWLGRCHLFVDTFTRDTLLAHDRLASGRVASARDPTVCGDVSPMRVEDGSRSCIEVLRLGAKTCDGADTDIGHELEHIKLQTSTHRIGNNIKYMQMHVASRLHQPSHSSRP